MREKNHKMSLLPQGENFFFLKNTEAFSGFVNKGFPFSASQTGPAVRKVMSPFSWDNKNAFKCNEIKFLISRWPYGDYITIKNNYFLFLLKGFDNLNFFLMVLNSKSQRLATLCIKSYITLINVPFLIFAPGLHFVFRA